MKENIRALSKALGLLFNEELHGFFIVKATVENFKMSNGEEKDLRSEIIKSSSFYKVCSGCLYEEGEAVSNINVTLLKGELNKGKVNSEVIVQGIFNDGELGQTMVFTKEEIRGFSRDTGDLNKIHFDEKPIVQGLLILEFLEKYLNTLKIHYKIIEIKFINPLFANEEAKIVIQDNKFSIYSNNNLIIKGEIK